jgi:hypothetical protein
MSAAEETAPKQGTTLSKNGLIAQPDMQSVAEVTKFVQMRRKRDEAIRKASAAVRRKSTPFSKETFKQVRGGAKLGKYESWLERLRVRAYPNDRINSAAYLAAMKKQAALPAAQITTSTVSSVIGTRSASAATAPMAVITPTLTATRGPVWEFIGPRNMSGSAFGEPSETISGRVNEIVYDPRTPSTVYLCAAQGGIWKSVNGGRDWFSLSTAFPMLATTSIAVSPANSQILLVGLGDHHGGDNFGDIPGVMRSIDGGRSWEVVGQLMAGPAAVSSIAFDPDAPNNAIAATGGGLL